MKIMDSMKDTIAHIRLVRRYIIIIMRELDNRRKNHDRLKLKSPEKEIYDKYTPLLKNSTYGSEEYKSFLKGMKPALDHHYANYRHHPEHFENGVNDMNLVDVMEMLCDWCAASKRHANGNIYRSIDISCERFQIDDQLKQILINTAHMLEEAERERDYLEDTTP